MRGNRAQDEDARTRLFSEQISNWRDWGKVFQSIKAFEPLARHILNKERLPAAQLENLTPGTNAVFKAGDYVVKIFAPASSGIDQTLDLRTELFATARANNMGVSAPVMVAHGFVEDKYSFAYIITEYVAGVGFPEAARKMSGFEKTVFGRSLRAVTDKMNTPCEPFNSIDVINDTGRYLRWDGRYSDRFRKERLDYIKTYGYGEKVFVHGDLCGDNILVTPGGELFIIDFADAVLAPPVYEHSLVAVELFNLDPAFLAGYFGDYTVDDLTDICFSGLLIHDFGGDVVAQRIGEPSEFRCLNDLRNRVKTSITR